MAHPAIPWTPHGAVLVASADRSFREKMVRQFRTAATVVEEAAGGAEALDKMEHGDWCLLLLDRSLPDLDSNELAASVKKRFGTRVVMVGSGSESSGTESVGQRLAELEDEIANRRGISAAECANPIDEVAAPKGTEEAETARMQQERGLPGMIGDSAAMQHLYRVVRLVAPRATTVLLTGATGTGKELVAQAIHILSPRAAHPLITVNCAAIPEALLESELFGHARGAFTGAVQFQAGRVHAAQGGTLFLDEIGELPLSLQAKLLRFLEQKEVQRLGTAEVLRVDVRVIAATNTNLALQVRERRFREDLFYRLLAFPVELPPLSERTGDVRQLTRYFLHKLALTGGRVAELAADASALIEARTWEGNVRELQLTLERASILASESNVIRIEHLQFLPRGWAFPARKNADSCKVG